MGRAGHPIGFNRGVGEYAVRTHRREIDELRAATIAGVDGDAIAFPIVGDAVACGRRVVENPGDVRVVAAAAEVVGNERLGRGNTL